MVAHPGGEIQLIQLVLDPEAQEIPISGMAWRRLLRGWGMPL